MYQSIVLSNSNYIILYLCMFFIGIPDLIMLLIQLTQDMMNSHLKISYNRLECTVLEVKIIDGLGATVDVILRNGVLHQGDTIVLCGLQGAIVTSIRALLTPRKLNTNKRTKIVSYIQ